MSQLLNNQEGNQDNTETLQLKPRLFLSQRLYQLHKQRIKGASAVIPENKADFVEKQFQYALDTQKVFLSSPKLPQIRRLDRLSLLYKVHFVHDKKSQFQTIEASDICENQGLSLNYQILQFPQQIDPKAEKYKLGFHVLFYKTSAFCIFLRSTELLNNAESCMIELLYQQIEGKLGELHLAFAVYQQEYQEYQYVKMMQVPLSDLDSGIQCYVIDEGQNSIYVQIACSQDKFETSFSDLALQMSEQFRIFCAGINNQIYLKEYLLDVKARTSGELVIQGAGVEKQYQKCHVCNIA